MKKIIKITLILIIFIIVLNNFSIAVLKPSDFNNPDYSHTGDIKSVGEQIITIISVIGSITSVVVLVALGIKYMLGSVEEKAEYKKTLLPYVIGAAFVFAGSNIAGIVYSIINQ